MNKLRHILSSVFFRLYKWTKGPVADYFTAKELKYVADHELPPDENYEPYKHQYSSYFKKWGLKVPMVVAEYCSRMSGIKADTYLPRDLSFNYIYPYLVRYEFCPAYADKNIEARVLNIKKVQETVDVLLPKAIVYNMNGVYFDGQDNEISADMAAQLMVKYDKDTIMKPALGTFGGVGVIKVHHKECPSKEDYLRLFSEYKKDFVIQEVVEQHPGMASFNETSVNTMRIVTYRRPNKERKMLYAIMRFGGKGAIKDNVCAGGGFCVINPDGKLKDRIVHVYQTPKLDKLPDSTVNDIPCFDKAVKAALALHGQLPHFDVMGWDFAITPDEHPVLIEYNIRPGYGIQSGTGPMFTEEELDELMPHVMKHRKTYVVKPYVHFEEKPDFDSFWDV